MTLPCSFPPDDARKAGLFQDQDGELEGAGGSVVGLVWGFKADLLCQVGGFKALCQALISPLCYDPLPLCPFPFHLLDCWWLSSRKHLRCCDFPCSLTAATSVLSSERCTKPVHPLLRHTYHPISPHPVHPVFWLQRVTPWAFNHRILPRMHFLAKSFLPGVLSLRLRSQISYKACTSLSCIPTIF